MGITAIIIRELENLNEEIKSRLDGKNITNTGNAKRSLRVEHDNNNYRSVGIFYLEFLNAGRGGGKFPNVSKIENWVRTKLGISEDKKVKQVAFLVSRKIAKLGTEIFSKNSKGIELENLILKLKKNINREISEQIKIDIIQKLDKYEKLKFKI